MKKVLIIAIVILCGTFGCYGNTSPKQIDEVLEADSFKVEYNDSCNIVLNNNKGKKIYISFRDNKNVWRIDFLSSKGEIQSAYSSSKVPTRGVSDEYLTWLKSLDITESGFLEYLEEYYANEKCEY